MRLASRMRKGANTTATRLLPVLLLAWTLNSGCSVRQFAINKLAGALAGSGRTFAADDDPQLVREAAPFSLKLMESLLAESPHHRGLLLAACKGFTQYSYGFVQQEAEEMEIRDIAAARAMRERARRLYLRACNYGLRGLEASHPGFVNALRKDPGSALRQTTRADVPLLYWTAVCWGAAISLSKDKPEVVADQPLVGALIDRALELDETFDSGAIHCFLITYEMARPGITAVEAQARAMKHFDRAMELSGGKLASPLVALAEQVAVAKQDRTQFEALLKRALAIDPDATPEWRLENLIMQRRARWLLDRADELFAE